jgi:hypothetical protein
LKRLAIGFLALMALAADASAQCGPCAFFQANHVRALLRLSVPRGSTPPASGNSVGDLWYDTDDSAIYGWDGDSWEGLGGGGGGDATTLDGLDSLQFLRSDASDTWALSSGAGTLTLGDAGDAVDVIGSLAVRTNLLWGSATAGVAAVLGDADGGADTIAIEAGVAVVGTLTVGGNTVWHAGNDGAASTLDADLLDGIDSGSFLRSDVDDSWGVSGSAGVLTLGDATGGADAVIVVGTLAGSVASGGDLTLEGTTHATDGTVFLSPSGGGVGIETGTPSGTTILHVERNTNTYHESAFENSDAGASARAILSVRNGTSLNEALRLEASGTGMTTFAPFIQDGASVISELNLSGGLTVGTRHASAPFMIYTAGSERVRVEADGDVAIGRTSADQDLDVQGQIKIRGGTPGAGKILESDADGDASWTTPVYTPAPMVVGAKLEWVSVTQVRLVPSGVDSTAWVTLFDGTDLKLFEIVANVTADITASGANGLDTGAEGASTFYHLFGIGKSDGTFALLLSTSATAPTMPATYTFKRLLGGVRNNASSNFVPFEHAKDGTVRYRTGADEQGVSVLSGGTATATTAVDLTGAIPNVVGVKYTLRTLSIVNNATGTSYSLYESSGGAATDRFDVETHSTGSGRRSVGRGFIPHQLRATLSTNVYYDWSAATAGRSLDLFVTDWNLGFTWN